MNIRLRDTAEASVFYVGAVNIYAETGPDRAIPSFGASDTTPSVSGSNVWNTDGTAQTLTDFDGGYAGQIVTVISTDATVFDTTSTSLTGSSTDITTADGDVSQWISEDGDKWILISWIDVSDDNSQDN